MFKEETWEHKNRTATTHPMCYSVLRFMFLQGSSLR
jgi:hypothetical protein